MAHPQTYASPPNPPMSGAARVQVESEREQIAEEHAHDSSSVAPSRADQPRVLLRSPTMWGLLYLPALTVMAVVTYMLVHLHPGPGRIPGAGDHGAPNAQPGDK